MIASIQRRSCGVGVGTRLIVLRVSPASRLLVPDPSRHADCERKRHQCRPALIHPRVSCSRRSVAHASQIVAGGHRKPPACPLGELGVERNGVGASFAQAPEEYRIRSEHPAARGTALNWTLPGSPDHWRNCARSHVCERSIWVGGAGRRARGDARQGRQRNAAAPIGRAAGDGGLAGLPVLAAVAASGQTGPGGWRGGCWPAARPLAGGVVSPLSVQPSIPKSFAAVPPRIATRWSSVSPGVFSTRSTSVLVHGNG